MPALYSVTAPDGVILPIRLLPTSVNQRLPSGPATISEGRLSGVIPALNSVTSGVPAAADVASSAAPTETAATQRIPLVTGHSLLRTRVRNRTAGQVSDSPQ